MPPDGASGGSYRSDLPPSTRRIWPVTKTGRCTGTGRPRRRRRGRRCARAAPAAPSARPCSGGVPSGTSTVPGRHAVDRDLRGELDGERAHEALDRGLRDGVRDVVRAPAAMARKSEMRTTRPRRCAQRRRRPRAPGGTPARALTFIARVPERRVRLLERRRGGSWPRSGRAGRGRRAPRTAARDELGGTRRASARSAGERRGAAAERADRRRGLLGGAGRGAVVDGDVGAGLGQRERDRAADADARAGDEGGLPGERRSRRQRRTGPRAPGPCGRRPRDRP